MFLLEFLLAIIFSFIAVAIAVMAGKKGPWDNLGLLFMVVFLITWAGGLWITPTGPALMGAYWVPYLVIAGLFTLLLINLVPFWDKKIMRAPEEKLEESEPEEVAAIATLGIAFWIFVCGLILSIGIAYLV